MKIKVLKKFKDKHTGEIHDVASVFEADEERIAEIRKIDATLIEPVNEEPEPVKRTRTKKAGK